MLGHCESLYLVDLISNKYCERLNHHLCRHLLLEGDLGFDYLKDDKFKAFFKYVTTYMSQTL